MIIMIKVIPKASRTEIVGWEGEYLKIRVKGVPEKGEVNLALIDFLSEKLGIAKSRIEIISGQTSRLKRVKIEGIEQVTNLT
ncbi:MAG: DUF167 domain-containing protein [Verrucomicrobia bacterium]|nr:DUF167 domain-containing protein [Verrucomicrobiota bacterium]